MSVDTKIFMKLKIVSGGGSAADTCDGGVFKYEDRTWKREETSLIIPRTFHDVSLVNVDVAVDGNTCKFSPPTTTTTTTTEIVTTETTTKTTTEITTIEKTTTITTTTTETTETTETTSAHDDVRTLMIIILSAVILIILILLVQTVTFILFQRKIASFKITKITSGRPAGNE